MSVPTYGFNVETITYKNTKISMWDIGGSEEIRKGWQKHFEGANGLIYVVDSHD